MYSISLTDNELLACYQKSGENGAMGMLYKRYSPLIFGICYKYLRREEEAKDAVSEIFLIVLDKARDHEIGCFRNWLYTVTLNYLHSGYGRKYTKVAEELEIIHENLMAKEEEGLLLNNPYWSHLHCAFEQLNDDQKTCVELFYMRDKSYKEVAQATGFGMNKVKSCIQNGKRNLRNYFQKNHIGYEKGKT